MSSSDGSILPQCKRTERTPTSSPLPELSNEDGSEAKRQRLRDDPISPGTAAKELSDILDLVVGGALTPEQAIKPSSQSPLMTPRSIQKQFDEIAHLLDDGHDPMILTPLSLGSSQPSGLLRSSQSLSESPGAMQKQFDEIALLMDDGHDPLTILTPLSDASSQIREDGLADPTVNGPARVLF